MMKRSLLALGFSSALLFSAAACSDKEPPKEKAAEKGSQAPSASSAGSPKTGADGVEEGDIPGGSKKGTLDSKGQVNEAAAKGGKDGAGASEVDASAIQDIFFDYDRSDIRPEARETLKAVAEILKKNKNASLTIEGHCDARGTEEYNQGLGQRRADSARAYLVNLGITRKRISTVSFGESQANQNADSENAWQQDRRAKFVFN